MKRLVFLLFCPLALFAQVGVMKTKLTSLIIYNAGFGYFVREGEGQLEKGYISLDYLPQASSGSFWIYVKQKNAFIDTVINPVENTVDFKDKAELLASLQGKIGERLKIEMVEGGISEGKLTHILPDLILLEGDKGQISAIQPDKVKKVVLLDYPLKVKVGGIEENDRVSIRMSYLQSGLTWSPSYLLYITGEKDATLSLRATVVNNLETWEDITCYFAVGMPKFLWRGVIDPLVTRTIIVPTDGMTMTRAPSAKEKEAGAPPLPEIYGGYPPPLVSLGGEELATLYLYKKEGFSLKKGDVGAVTLFNVPVSYKHIYVWEADQDKILHLVSFKNTTDGPLVSGSILAVEGGNPLGQDILGLVPLGGEGRVTLGVASELEGKVEETEISREMVETKEKEPKTYANIRIRGRLELTNRGKKEVEVEVNRTVMGQVLSSSPQAMVTLISSEGLNPRNRLFWKVKVPAGGKLELTYEYQTLRSLLLPPIRPLSPQEVGAKEGEVKK